MVPANLAETCVHGFRLVDLAAEVATVPENPAESYVRERPAGGPAARIRRARCGEWTLQ